MNIFKQVQSLQKSPIDVGGLCSIAYFKIEDVQTWPQVNPQTGIYTTAIQLKPGKSIYLCQAVDKGRSFTEESKFEAAGVFYDIQVDATLAGTNTSNILTLGAAPFHRWGLIVKDRSGHYRLIGNKDSGAKFTYKYSSGDNGSSRKVLLSWSWEHSLPAPVYLSQTFAITVGGQVVTAGSLTLVMRFRVGAPGAPMNHGDTQLINPALVNKNLLILADGTGLPVDDLTGQINWAGIISRHVEKALASDQITFLGGVIQDEIIEIYAFN